MPKRNLGEFGGGAEFHDLCASVPTLATQR